MVRQQDRIARAERFYRDLLRSSAPIPEQEKSRKARSAARSARRHGVGLRDPCCLPGWCWGCSGGWCRRRRTAPRVAAARTPRRPPCPPASWPAPARPASSPWRSAPFVSPLPLLQRREETALRRRAMNSRGIPAIGEERSTKIPFQQQQEQHDSTTSLEH